MSTSKQQRNGGASDIVIVKAEIFGEDPRATGGLVSNLPHPRVNKTKQHTHSCVRGPFRECRSIQSGTSGLPYYCAPLVCVSEGDARCVAV